MPSRYTNDPLYHVIVSCVQPPSDMFQENDANNGDTDRPFSHHHNYARGITKSNHQVVYKSQEPELWAYQRKVSRPAQGYPSLTKIAHQENQPQHV